MPQRNMADETTQLALITIINFISFIPAVILVVACFMGTCSQFGAAGMFSQLGVTIAVTLILAAAAFVISKLFPERRTMQFTFLFKAAEGILILFIAIAGVQLAVNTMNFSSITDPFNTIGLINQAFVRDSAAFEVMAQSPQLYVFNSLQWIVMVALGSGSEIMSAFMLVLNFIAAICAYRVARFTVGRMGAVIAFALCMLLPSQTANAGIVNPYVLSAIIVLLHLLVFYARGMSARRGEEIQLRIVYSVLVGLTLGLAVFTEPAAMVLLVLEPVFICFLQKDRNGINPEEFRHTLLQAIIILLLSLITFSSLMQVKASDLSRTVYQIYDDYFSYLHREFSFPADVVNVWGLNSYADGVMHYQSALQNQIVYGGMIILAAVFAAASLALKDTATMCLRFVAVTEIMTLSRDNKGAISQYAAIFLLAVMAGGIFEYAYTAFRRLAADERLRNAFFLAERGKEIQAELAARRAQQAEPKPEIVPAAEPEPEPISAPVYEPAAAPEPEPVSALVYEQPVYMDAGSELQEGVVLTIDDVVQPKPVETAETSEPQLFADAFVSFADADDIFADDPLSGTRQMVINKLPENIPEEPKAFEGEGYIENPLPIVRKTAGSAMEFDFDVSDDDDFDFD